MLPSTLLRSQSGRQQLNSVFAGRLFAEPPKTGTAADGGGAGAPSPDNTRTPQDLDAILDSTLEMDSILESALHQQTLCAADAPGARDAEKSNKKVPRAAADGGSGAKQASPDPEAILEAALQGHPPPQEDDAVMDRLLDEAAREADAATVAAQKKSKPASGGAGTAPAVRPDASGKKAEGAQKAGKVVRGASTDSSGGGGQASRTNSVPETEEMQKARKLLQAAEKKLASGAITQDTFDKIRKAATTVNPNLGPANGAAPKQAPATDLMGLSEQGDAQGVRRLLAGGADPNAATAQGTTPLLVATRCGHVAVVEALVGAGANVNQAGAWGFTPLMYAAIFGKTEIVRLLLTHDADPRPKDKRQETAYQHAVNEQRLEIAELLQKAELKYQTPKIVELEDIDEGAPEGASVPPAGAAAPASPPVDLEDIDEDPPEDVSCPSPAAASPESPSRAGP